MAYRRKQGISRVSTFKEDYDDDFTSSSSSAAPSSSLAAQAIRASAAHRDSSDHVNSASHSSFKDRSKGSATYDYTSMSSTNEPGGFWGVLARKAKAILDDDDDVPQRSVHFSTSNKFTGIQVQHQYESFDHSSKMDNPKLRMGLDRFKSSVNQIGDSIGNAFEEGRTIVDKKAQEIIQETRKMQNNRRGMTDEEMNQVFVMQEPRIQSAKSQTNQETQIKASRDVAIATAAKAKLLLRELKTVKADLAFAKQRSCQLEEENKKLREAHEKGDNPTDDDMISLQLETLLAEKARLANENSEYARENRFLREIVEYHQLSMQDVMYLDEDEDEDEQEIEEVNLIRALSVSPPSSHARRSARENSPRPPSTAPPSPSPRGGTTLKHNPTTRTP